MKKQTIMISVILFAFSLFAMEKVEYKMVSLDENLKESAMNIKIVCDTSRMLVKNEGVRFIIDFEKDTIIIVDDSNKSVMHMSLSMIGLFVSGLSDKIGIYPANESYNVKKTGKLRNIEGFDYPEYILSSDTIIKFTFYVDEKKEAKLIKKRLKKMKELILTLSGLDIGAIIDDEIKGIPVLLVNESDDNETKSYLTKYAVGDFKSEFAIPADYTVTK